MSENLEKAPTDTPRGKMKDHSRRQTIVFVVVFLVAVSAVIYGYSLRAVRESRANYWYLFKVAHHTAWLLDKIGDSASLEDHEMYRNKAAEYRAVLQAWKRDEDPPPLEEVPQTDAPLTAWEVWQYRFLKPARHAEEIRERLQALESLGGKVATSVEEFEQYTRDFIEGLEHALRPSPPHGVTNISERGLLARVRRLAARLDKAARDPMLGDRKFMEEAADTGVELEDIRQEEMTYLRERLAGFEANSQELGPHVAYVHRPGLDRQIQELEDELAEFAQSDKTGANRVAALEAQLAELRRRREEAIHGSEPNDSVQDFGFRFTVIPDCGAIPLMSIFAAAVMAFPARWWKKLLGILVGVPLLYGINIVRLACLGVIGTYTGGGELFDFAHQYVWQAIYIVFVVMVWLLWIELVVRRGKA